MSEWNKVRTIAEQLMSEGPLDPNEKYIIEKNGDLIGTIHTFFPAERYCGGMIIAYDLNGMRLSINQESMDTFLETYSDDELLEPSDIFIATSSEKATALREIYDEFMAKSSESGGHNRIDLMVNEIYELRCKVNGN